MLKLFLGLLLLACVSIMKGLRGMKGVDVERYMGRTLIGFCLIIMDSYGKNVQSEQCSSVGMSIMFDAQRAPRPSDTSLHYAEVF
jgi:hypothetical protein